MGAIAVAFGVIADIGPDARNDAFDPKRTSAIKFCCTAANSLPVRRFDPLRYLLPGRGAYEAALKSKKQSLEWHRGMSREFAKQFRARTTDSVRKKRHAALRQRLKRMEAKILGVQHQIGEHREVIIKLERTGLPAEHAKYLLAGLELLQAVYRDNRSTMLAELSQLRADASMARR